MGRCESYGTATMTALSLVEYRPTTDAINVTERARVELAQCP